MSPERATCGFRSYCGRSAGHRGHHGGWRTGVRGVVPMPYPHVDQGSARLGTEIPAGDLKLLAEYAVHGTIAEAAACVGMAYQTAKNHLRSAHVRTGASTAIEVFAALGWLVVPAHTLSQHRGAA